MSGDWLPFAVVFAVSFAMTSAGILFGFRRGVRAGAFASQEAFVAAMRRVGLSKNEEDT
jgi:hypothetical protein